MRSFWRSRGMPVLVMISNINIGQKSFSKTTDPTFNTTKKWRKDREQTNKQTNKPLLHYVCGYKDSKQTVRPLLTTHDKHHLHLQYENFHNPSTLCIHHFMFLSIHCLKYPHTLWDHCNLLHISRTTINYSLFLLFLIWAQMQDHTSVRLRLMMRLCWHTHRWPSSAFTNIIRSASFTPCPSYLIRTLSIPSQLSLSLYIYTQPH